MSIPNQLSLLRRTFAALAAAAALGAVSDAHSQGRVKLTGASGKDECSYSSMSITPDGSVTVTCSGTTPPPPPPPLASETYSMSTGSITAPPNSVVEFAVTRTGPAGTTFAATTVSFTYSGSGCAITGTYPVAFAAGQTTSPIQAPVSAGGTCAATLLPPTAPAVLGTPATTTITVGSGTPPPGQVAANCPAGFAPPENMVSASLLGLGNPLIAMQKSGQVISIPLPNLQGLNTGQITFGESSTAATPQPVTLEISINQCPGLIDKSPSSCNLTSTMSSYNSITWFARAYSIITDAASADRRGYCWGGEPGAKYYVNARWSYQSCPFGAQVCGFAVQYNQGPY